MRFLRYAIILLLLLQVSSAADYKQEFYLDKGDAKVIINVNYTNTDNFNFYLDLPKDVKEIKAYLDDEEKKFQVRESQLINFVNIFGRASNARIEYSSSYYIETASKKYFTAEIIPVINGNLEIKVFLPEGAVLDKPYSEKAKNSIYPKPSKLETDGKRLIINWNDKAQSYEPFSVFIIYNEDEFNYYILISLFLIALIAFVIFKTVKKRELKIKKIKVDHLEKHLKDDEKLIVNILKKKGGRCTQATLLTLTNMSKASLSRLLLELENRKIIEKEQQGNKNLIILKRR